MHRITFKYTAVLLIILCSFRLNAADTLSLNDAILKKKISAVITGMEPTKTGDVLHFGECIRIKMTCLGDQPLVILFKTGTTLKCKDASISNAVISKMKTIALVPKKENNSKLFAICSEYTKLTPNNAHAFTVGDPCSDALKRVLKEIEILNFQNAIGQYAVWCATDKLELSGLLDLCKDKVKTSNLVKAVCKAQLIPVPKAYANAKMSMRVYFTYTLTDTSNVKIILYNKTGDVVLYFLTAKEKPTGEYKESYWITDADLEPGDYQALLYVNGVPVQTEDIKF